MVQTPFYDCKEYERVPIVDAAAVENDNGEIVLFAVNRDMQEGIELTADLRDYHVSQVQEHIVLHCDDVKAANTECNPDRVEPVRVADGQIDGGKLQIRLPALSWNVIRLSQIG